jgi:hypothetical protein
MFETTSWKCAKPSIIFFTPPLVSCVV